MKKTLIVLITSLSLFGLAHATVTLTGTSLNNAPGLGDDKQGAYIVQTDGNPFSLGSLNAGISLSSGSTFGGIYEIVGLNSTVEVVPGVLNTLGSGVTFALDGGINAGDFFGIVVFDSSSATTLAGDSYQIWSDATWIVPSDGSDVSFAGSPTAGQFQQLGTAGTSGTVVPEPSAYAILTGAVALVLVMLRRRG